MEQQIEVKNIELAPKYGFIKSDEYDEYHELHGKGITHELCIGHSRRGQWYSFFIADEKLILYASQPDGSGGPVPFTEELLQLLFQMRQDGFI